MTGVANVSARFEVQPSVNLTVTKAGKGTGTVSATGLDCGATCSTSYPVGTAITLTEAPAAGSTFAGWGGACSGTGACTFTLTANSSVTATFDLTPVAFTVRKTGPGKGFVGGASGIDCGPTCTANVTPGTSISLVASAAPGSAFAGWSGSCGRSPACTLVVNGPSTLTARFVKARDTAPPTVRAFAASGTPGALVKLRFTANDAGGGSLRSTAKIFSGSRLLTQLSRRAPVGARSTFSWRIPVSPPPGLRFCVQTRDAAGNLSRAACASIRIA
jgi:hypothetical protein